MSQIFNKSGGDRKLHSFKLQSLEAAFLEKGGIRERMTQARLEARDGDVPACPDCGKPMRKRKSQTGEFWGCSGYPDCRGRRSI